MSDHSESLGDRLKIIRRRAVNAPISVNISDFLMALEAIEAEMKRLDDGIALLKNPPRDIETPPCKLLVTPNSAHVCRLLDLGWEWMYCDPGVRSIVVHFDLIVVVLGPPPGMSGQEIDWLRSRLKPGGKLEFIGF